MSRPARPLALLLALAVLPGCGGGPEPSPEPSYRVPSLGRPGVRLLRDYVHAGYDLLLLRDAPVAAPDRDPGVLEARRLEALGALRSHLRDAGADPDRLEDPRDLMALVGEAIDVGGRYAVVFTSTRGSFALVRVTEERDREVILFGEPFVYRLLVHDETLVEDYPSYRARRLAPEGGAPVARPATYAPGLVRLDRAAIERIGRERFLPRVAALRERARLVGPDAFVALAREERLEELLALAKDGLRWRSLQGLWSRTRARPADERLEAFVDDYAARAELRAAAELRELGRLRPEGDARPLERPERVLLYERGALSAALHGDPLGQVADVLALAAAPLPPEDPTFLGASRLVLELIGALREGEGPEASARAFARLARADPEELRRLARALLARR